MIAGFTRADRAFPPDADVAIRRQIGMNAAVASAACRPGTSTSIRSIDTRGHEPVEVRAGVVQSRQTAGFAGRIEQLVAGHERGSRRSPNRLYDVLSHRMP